MALTGSFLVAASPLFQAATVTGRVRDLAGEPISGARVTLFTPRLERFHEVRTDPQGTFVLEGVEEGDYSLGASATDLEYQEVQVALGAELVVKDFSLGPELHPGRWTVAGNTLPEYLDATDIAVVIPDGRVYYCHDTHDPILFDPRTGRKSFPNRSDLEQGCMNATLLEDGRIIVVGGQNPGDPGSFRNAVPWVKAYSVPLDSWERFADLRLAAGRWYPGLARLADGSLLTMGGGTRPGAARTSTCELFDPSTRSWSLTGSMINPCEFPPSALLFTGDVLATWWPPQLYRPTTGKWRLTGNFNQPDRGWPGHSDHSLAVLADGRVLVLGIRKGAAGNRWMGEVYDPLGEDWKLTSNPALVRLQTEVVPLPDGRVLVAGGETESASPGVEKVLGIVKWCDLYDPLKDRWRRVADMNHFREYHAVALLVPDGRVLTTGGTRIKFQVGPTSADIEAFEPPYLFRGVRPRITALSSARLPRGGGFSMEVVPRARITSLVLLGTGATTHWVDAGIPRRIVLPAAQDGGTVRGILPSYPNVLPLGWYLLFAMVDDIPSEGEIVKVVPEEVLFRRGDADRNEKVDLLDVMFLLNYLFLGGDQPPCRDAADANDDGRLNLVDPVAILFSLFGGLRVPPPYPDPGADPTEDDLTCN